MTTEEFRRRRDALAKRQQTDMAIYIVVCAAATVAWIKVLAQAVLMTWGK